MKSLTIAGTRGVCPVMLNLLRSKSIWIAGACYVALSLMACNTDVASPPSLEYAPEGLFVRLEMNHRAVLLSTFAPYDTVRLATIPMGSGNVRWKPAGMSDAEIDSLLGANPPMLISQDSTRIRVSRDGLVQVVRATTAAGTVRIIATQTIGPITRACTTLVRALPVEHPSTIKRLQISTVDSLKVAANSRIPFVVTGMDADDVPISNIVTYVTTSNVGIMLGDGAGWNKTSILGGARSIGEATVSVSSLVFGTPITNSVVLRNGAPLSDEIRLGGIQWIEAVSDVIIGPGGTVGWFNDSTSAPVDRDVDVIFDMPAAALAALDPAKNTGSGNIIGIPGDPTLTRAQKTRYRRFTEPGIYKYRVVPRNQTGRIIVWDR